MKWAIYNDKQINFCKLLKKINRGKNIGIFWGGKDRKKKSYPTLLRKITLSDRIDHIQTFRTVNKCKQKSGCTVCFKKILPKSSLHALDLGKVLLLAI